MTDYDADLFYHSLLSTALKIFYLRQASVTVPCAPFNRRLNSVFLAYTNFNTQVFKTLDCFYSDFLSSFHDVFIFSQNFCLGHVHGEILTLQVVVLGHNFASMLLTK